jgi:hypothetical protein
MLRPPLLTQKDLHQVIASPRRYNVKNSAAYLSVMLTAWVYAYILKIKFSVSLCLPSKVNGFSNLIAL